jgi:hypothetical protein
MARSRSRQTEEESPPPSAQDAADELPTLSISPEKVCFIIFKAREFDVKEEVTDPDDASNPSDDNMISVLEDRSDDPVLEELTSIIAGLSEDEQIDLVTLAWLGRDDNTLEDWRSLREEAARAHSTRATQAAEYLLGMPLLSDYLEEALSQLGHACDDLERGRL